MSFKITMNKDTSVWDAMKKNVIQPNPDELKIGFWPESVYGPDNDNLPVAQVAQWNEEGTTTNPPRPFMRVGLRSQLATSEYQAKFRQSVQRIVEGKTTFKQEYTLFGKELSFELQDVISKWSTPPNSPDTVDAKGSNDPLVWTGTMLESVKYKIEKKGDDD